MSKRNRSVFEKYAHEYDIMTSAGRRLATHGREVAAIIRRFKPATVLDAGCGTGLTTFLFAQQGVSAVGLDRSRAMLAEARKKYGTLALPMQFRYGRFECLPKSMHGCFDLVVCLANSIVGVGSKANLRRALRSFNQVLMPGGTLVIQMLNYQAVSADGIYPIRATEAGGIVYQRFFERHGKNISVYVLRTDLNQNPPTLEVFRSTLDPFGVEYMMAALRREGFRGARRFGNLPLRKLFSKKARDLVLVAQSAPL